MSVYPAHFTSPAFEKTSKWEKIWCTNKETDSQMSLSFSESHLKYVYVAMFCICIYTNWICLNWLEKITRAMQISRSRHLLYAYDSNCKVCLRGMDRPLYRTDSMLRKTIRKLPKFSPLWKMAEKSPVVSIHPNYNMLPCNDSYLKLVHDTTDVWDHCIKYLTSMNVDTFECNILSNTTLSGTR